MTPDEIKADYRAALDRVGEAVTLRRFGGPAGPNRPHFDADVRARVTGYQPEQLVGGITQGERRCIILVEDLLTAQWPVPPTINDSIMIRGKLVKILAVDDSTRRVAGELIAYEIRAAGA